MTSLVKITTSETIYNEKGITVGSIYISIDISDVSRVNDLKEDMEAFVGVLKKNYLGEKIEQNGSQVN